MTKKCDGASLLEVYEHALREHLVIEAVVQLLLQPPIKQKLCHFGAAHCLRLLKGQGKINTRGMGKHNLKMQHEEVRRGTCKIHARWTFWNSSYKNPEIVLPHKKGPVTGTVR